jgi:hypothetical protein
LGANVELSDYSDIGFALGDVTENGTVTVTGATSIVGSAGNTALLMAVIRNDAAVHFGDVTIEGSGAHGVLISDVCAAPGCRASVELGAVTVTDVANSALLIAGAHEQAAITIAGAVSVNGTGADGVLIDDLSVNATVEFQQAVTINNTAGFSVLTNQTTVGTSISFDSNFESGTATGNLGGFSTVGVAIGTDTIGSVSFNVLTPFLGPVCWVDQTVGPSSNLNAVAPSNVCS